MIINTAAGQRGAFVKIRPLLMYRQNIHFPAKDADLREDVHALGALIGEILTEQGGEELFDLVEGDRLSSIRRREGETSGVAELASRTHGRSPAAAKDLTRAFSTWFQAVNTAEKVHRVRRRRQYLKDSSTPQPGGIGDCLARLKREGMGLAEVLSLISSLSIEPVFTAHPTESTRRTVLRKQQQVAECLISRADKNLTPPELAGIWGRLRAEISTMWQTEEHPRERLTVADEREHVLFYLAEILYRIVPLFYEEIETAIAVTYGVDRDSVRVPPILRFGSWVGGDMDGNADVHAKTIRETLHRQRQIIISTYFSECQNLAEALSQSASRVGVNEALTKRIDEYNVLLPGAQSITPARHDRMPYRVFFGQVAERLKTTYDGRPNGYEWPEQLSADLQLVADSLLAHRGRHAGYFLVQRLQRRVETFGFHLATLDVRQHANVHNHVIAQGLNDASLEQVAANERLLRMRDLLERDQGPISPLDATGRRTLWVFEAIAQARHKYGSRAIGDYLVSGANGPEDVLAVLLLARWADIVDARTGECPIDIAPVLESIDSLQRAGEFFSALQAEPAYQRHAAARGNRQIVVIGFSDSNKEGGIAASRWALQVAAMQLTQAAKTSPLKPTLFYGRGGTPARGGGSVERLVESAPAGALHGVLRLTEQGEVVSQSYGLRAIAMRTLERAFSSLAIATHAATRGVIAAPEAHCAAMSSIARRSMQTYRDLIYSAEFFAYFREATPIDVIERMHIGSRPATKENMIGVDGIRAVPWVFAWSQSRHMVPGWFGFGSGMQAAIEAHGPAVIDNMLAHWPFFANLIDDIEAMLARTDLDIAAQYDALATQSLRRAFTPIRAEYELTVAQVLKLRATTRLLDSDPTLQRAIKLRNPYVDPMHLMQVDLLQRWRASERRDRQLFEALLSTISGIAQGLQATG
jgi:phosphoenolpyruvate carboxylase